MNIKNLASIGLILATSEEKEKIPDEITFIDSFYKETFGNEQVNKSLETFIDSTTLEKLDSDLPQNILELLPGWYNEKNEEIEMREQDRSFDSIGTQLKELLDSNIYENFKGTNINKNLKNLKKKKEDIESIKKIITKICNEEDITKFPGILHDRIIKSFKEIGRQGDNLNPIISEVKKAFIALNKGCKKLQFYIGNENSQHQIKNIAFMCYSHSWKSACVRILPEMLIGASSGALDNTTLSDLNNELEKIAKDNFFKPIIELLTIAYLDLTDKPESVNIDKLTVVISQIYALLDIGYMIFNLPKFLRTDKASQANIEVRNINDYVFYLVKKFRKEPAENQSKIELSISDEDFNQSTSKTKIDLDKVLNNIKMRLVQSLYKYNIIIEEKRIISILESLINLLEINNTSEYTTIGQIDSVENITTDLDKMISNTMENYRYFTSLKYTVPVIFILDVLLLIFYLKKTGNFIEDE